MAARFSSLEESRRLARLISMSIASLLSLAALSMQLQSVPGVEIKPGTITNPSGVRQRTYVARPAGTKGPLPTVFFVPWLSCDSVALRPSARGGIEQLLVRIAADSGWALFLVDKPGVGESQGNCAATDFETELAGYRTAFDEALEDPWVDRQRVVVMGQSFSGAFLPAITRSTPVSGYIFINSWMRSWMERLITFERLRLEQQRDADPKEVKRVIDQLMQLYTMILLQRKTPAQATAERPDLASAWTEGPTEQYGRPIAFMQQLQQLVPDELWSGIDKPTLAIWGEADLVMHREDHERVVRLVNARRPGAARFIAVPGMDHGMLARDSNGARSLPAVVVTAVNDFLQSTR
jgi:pimeloyl-ACP methyl ester carboxylesterase